MFSNHKLFVLHVQLNQPDSNSWITGWVQKRQTSSVLRRMSQATPSVESRKLFNLFTPHKLYFLWRAVLLYNLLFMYWQLI